MLKVASNVRWGNDHDITKSKVFIGVSSVFYLLLLTQDPNLSHQIAC